MKLVHSLKYEITQISNYTTLLKKAILLLENNEFETAKFYLNEIIKNDECYSDAYVFRFLACMHTNDFDTAAEDFLTGFRLEKKLKSLKKQYSMAEVVTEFWYYSSFEQRKGLKEAIKNHSNNLKIVK